MVSVIVLISFTKKVEASPRIELGCKDLQSSASPLRHEAVRFAIKRVMPGV
jgi:hypothetical protein